jgi:hypothetical protein
MQFTEQDGQYYATDREARAYLTERGKKVSDSLTAQEIDSDEILTSKNIDIVREAQRKVALELTETCKPEEYKK